MTSYMYNPSKQVTSLLSEYLEFDEEQLQLGIWSGQLALRDVNLKADAVYPHLNQAFAESEAAQTDFTKAKPPMRVKLVSGSIGEMNLNIPWKNLVWGQGDVKVELRNVVIVVALESLEETNERMNKSNSGSLFETDQTSDPLDSSKGGEGEGSQDHAAKSRKRYQKQKILREAERRQLQGRDISNWLQRIYKKEEEERQREALRAGDPLVAQESKMGSWLKGATNDFFWRFYAGLQAKIENLKIIFVQDSIEVGIIIPSIQVTAGKEARERRRGSNFGSISSGGYDDDSSRGNEGVTHKVMAGGDEAPQNVVYESAYDDGEHVDKRIQILGFGVYVRKVAGKNRGPGDHFHNAQDHIVQVSDVTTKEYIVRPTELNIFYSLFYPYPPEKRKKKKERIEDAKGGDAVSVAPSTTSQSTSNSAKKRRGKREKTQTPVSSAKTTSSPPTEPSTPTGGGTPTTRVAIKDPKEQPPTAQTPSAAAPAAEKPKRKIVMRRMSIQTGRKPMAPPSTPAPAPPPSNEESEDSMLAVLARKNKATPSSSVATSEDGDDSMLAMLARKGKAPAASVASHDEDGDDSMLAMLARKGKVPAASVASRDDSEDDSMLAMLQRKKGASSSQTNSMLSMVSHTGSSTQPTQQSANSSELTSHRPAAAQQNDQAPAKPRFARRSSIAGPVKGSTAAAGVVSRVPKAEKKAVKKSAPLARRDDLSSTFTASSRSTSTAELTARLDGKLKVGPMEIMLSTKHYNLIDNFISAAARMRNGRPSQRISSVMDGANSGRHSFVVSTDDVGRMASVTSIDVESINLDLNEPRSERSQVVRSWWRYGLRAIQWEIRQRRKVRKHFQDKYLSFRWDRQKYRRKEYVSLFIAAKLMSPEESGAKASDSTAAETLSSIEDELPIEQILLYRSIARILHVGGARAMPDSLVSLHANRYRGRSGSEDKPFLRGSGRGLSRSSSMSSDEEPFGTGGIGNNERTILSMLEESCEITRLRMDGGHTGILPRHRALIKYDVAGERKHGMEESTIGMTLDTRNAGTRGAGFSRGSGRRSRSDESRGKDDSMKFSFSASMEKIDVNVVEEEVTHDGYGSRGNADDDVSRPSMSISEISDLTEDDRFSDSGTQETRLDDDSQSDNILQSTDFLLFKQPEKVLLRTSMHGLSCSALGSTSGSRNLNFQIRHIVASSGEDRKLLELGTEGDLDGSDSGLGVRSMSRGSGDDPDNDSPKSAVSLSLVLEKDQQVLEFDVARVKACYYHEAIHDLMMLGNSFKSTVPLIPSTPLENVRMYVVQQNVGSSFRFIDGSFRLHGFEVHFPEVNHQKKAVGDEMNPMDGASDTSVTTVTTAILLTDMVEIYSGRAANSLGIVKSHWQDTYNSTRLSVLGEDGQNQTKTRTLQMLDIDELISKKGAFMSFNVVVAVSGLDFVATSSIKDGIEEKRLSFLENPVDIEVFASMNESSVLDYNRAKREVVVKISEVHATFSESRLQLLSDVLPRGGEVRRAYVESAEPVVPPPRLEILARLMLTCIDLSVSRLRFCLMTDDQSRVGHSILSKSAQLIDFVTSFLRTVGKLDLSWPHEEALSSAMQICIDRLTGIGFQLDDAWQCANTALLNFLEDIQEAEEPDEGESPEDALDRLIHRSVSRTAPSFEERIDQYEHGGQLVENHLVLDFPEGAQMTAIDLFYDKHVSAVINSVFITNGEGIHILRLMPQVEEMEEEKSMKQDSDARSDAALSYDDVSYASESTKSTPALICRSFVVNQKYSFGKGGLPLAVLGGEIDKVTDVQQESLVDVDMGELELLFCEEVFEEALYAFAEAIKPLEEYAKSSGKKNTRHAKRANAQKSEDPSLMLVNSTCVSMLFTNEELIPFTRVILGNCVTTAESNVAGQNDLTKMSAKQLSLLYLAPDGELYPEQMCSHDMSVGPPFSMTLESSTEGDSKCVFEFKGTRVFMVYQYVAECYQYFYSGSVGLGLWLANSSGVLAKFQPDDGDSSDKSMAMEFVFIDCSLLIPRSSLSSEMIAFEMDRARVYFDDPLKSFDMPTEECVLALNGTHEERNEETNSDGGENRISRTVVEMERFQLFSSMFQSDETRDPEVFDNRESLAFNCFFEIDGRAEDNKRVYQQVAPPENYEIEQEKADRRWHSMSSNASSLRIIVDYAPHMRIFVSDDLGGATSGLNLDVTLSQFCLLMSCYYNNMSELPVMFPLSATDIEVGSKFIDSSTFPEFGSEEYRITMESAHTPTSEVALCLSRLSMRCTTDKQFETVTTEAEGILLGLDDCTIHVVSDDIGMTKVGAGALGASMVDDSKVHPRTIDVKNHKDVLHSWGDLTFGTSLQCNKFIDDLPLPFQMSVLMGPNASLYNLGMDSSVLTMSDFTTFFGFLGFVSVYFCEAELGYPYLRAVEFLNETKQDMVGDEEIEEPATDTLTDFRLFLSRPAIWVPVNPSELVTPFLILASEQGLWYRCATIDLFLSQESIVKGLTMSYVDEEDASPASLAKSLSFGKSLVEGLSLGLRIDFSGATNHSDYSVKLPYNGEWDCNITSPRISVDPLVIPKPTICKPVESPDRFLGPTVCEMTFVVDVLPAAFGALYNLFVGSTEEDEDPSQSQSNESQEKEDDESGSETNEEEDSEEEVPDATFSFSGGFGDLRLFVLDPVLGPHLPVAVLSIAALNMTASQFSSEVSDEGLVRGEAPPSDLQMFIDGNIWADSFKLGLTRSWEPLVESYHFTLLHEKSMFRGSGVTLRSDTPLHFNLTGAMLLVIDEVAESMLRVMAETFGSGESTVGPSTLSRPSDPREKCITYNETVGCLAVLHEFPRAVSSGDRVAFSVKNMTGQRLRAYRAEKTGGNGSSTATVSYVENGEATKLLFQPSVSRITNMKVAEGEFPGLENSPNRNIGGTGSAHAIDLQIPGFQWMRDVQIDNFGRRFVNLTPRSSFLRERAKEDWRVANVLKLLIEVGLENGGRELTAKSIFSVANKTTHTLSLVLHPNVSFTPDFEHKADIELKSGGVHQVPVLLLESALRMAGSLELGCIWLRPSNGRLPNTSSACSLQEKADEGLVAHFSSRPVRLGKTVGDSALLFDENKGAGIPPERGETGVQISCPVVGGSGEREEAPFCYAVEVGRSPIVKAPKKKTKKSDKSDATHIHGPVAYTLSVHAPFVVANLLPETGRFELMHAVRKTVLWFADLEPGQQVSIHSVGLDAPLLLLVNLRFCRTPIGEGALVHHGVDPPPEAREHIGRLRSIGKAGKAVTMQLGKTLTSLGETPDKRGHDILFQAQNKENQPVHDKKGQHNRKKVAKVTTDSGDSAIEDVDGKTYRVDTTIFFPENCVDETVLVDGVGQRLTLGIENIRGGGGQRRISVYCPFWIINTTEHSLLYRQERSKSCVSGSVLNPKMDGSQTLSGGHIDDDLPQTTISPRQDTSIVTPLNSRTIFAGTPGALATSPGRCELAPSELTHLLEEDLSLEDLSRLAFMFNFHEGSMPGGYQKLCVRLHDGSEQNRYESEWSRGFGLDSVGISQVVEMNCRDARALELTMVIQNAPGHLFKYTKILRFLPRFVVVNNLPYPVRLWQDNSVFRPPSAADVTVANGESKVSRRWRLVTNRKKKKDGKRINQYEVLWGKQVDITAEEAGLNFPAGTTAHPHALYVTSTATASWKPFNLPDTRADRQLRVGLGGRYSLTSSFSADVPGEHTLRVPRALDLRLMKHVSTRASPEYSITLPPRGESSFDGELGIWFETEWGTDRNLIVKAIRNDSFCYNKTDVHVGDELLLIDANPVGHMTFSDAMALLRKRIKELKPTPVEPPPAPITTPITAPIKSVMRRASLSFRFGASQHVEPKQEEKVSQVITPLTLTFRTVEERLRRVRLKAARSTAAKDQLDEGNSATGQSQDEEDETMYVKAELKTLHKSMYLVLGPTGTIPYEVHNRTKNSTIYFRQKNCHNHPWRILKPGASELYCWEEPMKTKRLTVRVATEDSFSLFSQAEPSGAGSDISSSEQDGSTTRPSSDTARLSMRKNKRITDEEEKSFSATVSVKLEEIGFSDRLTYRSGDQQKQLELEVDVVGSTRVLLVRDSSTDFDNENQLLIHLETLRAKCVEEEERHEHLRALRIQLPTSRDNVPLTTQELSSASAISETALHLMEDYPEEKTLTKCHQMVVEVIEATGLSPDNYVGTCNPYVEVYLQNALKRKNLFRSKRSQKTNYVRKSINPQWNSQSFVFDVPEEAVTVTRGHAVKLKVRNYRRMGNHAVLGRAQIDLHSVRGHSPLVGWFPLAGRTGRRELENSLSHWGRGSIKLKIHWVYTPSGLLDYFLILSQARLNDLNESVEGMAGQVEKWREEKLRRQERMDGFRAVRVNDLVPRKQNTPGNFQPPYMRKESELGSASLRATSEDGDSVRDISKEFNSFEGAVGNESIRNFGRKSVVAHGQSLTKGNQVEDQISMHRRNLQMASSMVPQNMRGLMYVSNTSDGAYGGTASFSKFRSWEEAKVFFNDDSLEIDYDGQEWNLSMKRKPTKAQQSDDDSLGEPQLAGRLKVPSQSPSLMKNAAQQHMDLFAVSRASVEKFARSSLRAALNPGGWLTIRPIQALNLPDSYNGMFVKVKYGTETYISETVDSTVYPTWFKPDENDMNGPVSAESLEYFPGDLHVYVPPQKTTGSISVSVVGEGQGQRLNAKCELGILNIPLGAAIAACVDSVEEHFDAQVKGEVVSPVYLRWFPLEDPKATRAIEGDRRMGSRPRESEKDSDNVFHDYLSPCIQLAMFWNPEVDFPDGERDDVPRGRPPPGSASQDPTSLVQDKPIHSSVVDQYFNAEIGQVSFALIDSRRAVELVSGCICDIDVRYWVTKAKTRFGVAVGWFQLDQQDDYAREPVILAPTPSEYIATVFQILAVKDNLRSKNDVLSFEFIDFSLVEFDLTLEETLLADLTDFLSALRLRGFLASTTSESDTGTEDLSTIGHERSLFDLGGAVHRNPESALLHLLSDNEEEVNGRQRVYIEQLFLGVVKFNLSYLKGTKETRLLDDNISGLRAGAFEAEKEVLVKRSAVHHEKSDMFTTWCQNTAQTSGTSFALPTIFTSLFPNVSDAPVRLQGKALNHVFESPSEIIQSIRKFYVNETLKQIYKIIGSLDFVGNPTMLFTSFFSGLRDLIVVPSQAFIQDKNVSSVGIGVAKGTLSLFSHSTSGFFGFTSKIFAVAGQALASASFNKEFREWHREQVLVEATNLNRTWKRRGVQSAKQMIVRPLGDVFVGVASGVAGLVVAPVRGYQRNGASGLLVGIAAGAVGVVIRPAVGVLDALSHFTASIHDIARSVNVLEKRFEPPIKYRLPYVFGTSLILMHYDDSVVRALHLLKRFPLKSSRRHGGSDEIMVHVEVLNNIGIDTYAIVTSDRLIIIRLVTGSDSPTLCWQVSLVGSAKVSSKVAEHGHNGFALTVFLKEQRELQGVADRSQDRASGSDLMSNVLDPETDQASNDDGLINKTSFEPGTEEFDHGTSRSEAGELITWYSVVAEYQYRRQLARLHNAISCVTGNFDDVIHDGTLGRPGSTQYFTSFGIFHFVEKAKEDSVVEAEEDPFEALLESIPWRLDEEVLSEKPEWLSRAHRRAILSVNEGSAQPVSASNDAQASGSNANQHTSGTVRKIARWITGRLPTIPDGEEDPAESPSRKDEVNEDGKTEQERSAVLEHDNGEVNRTVDVTTTEQTASGPTNQPASQPPYRLQSTLSADETFATAPTELQNGTEIQTSTTSSNDAIDSFKTAPGEMSMASGLSRDSFVSAIPSDESRARGTPTNSFVTASQSGGGSLLGMDSSQELAPSYSGSDSHSLQPLPPTSRNVSEQTTVHSNQSSPDKDNFVSYDKRSSSLRASYQEGQPTENAPVTPPRNTPQDQRLERMENIMEQLLVFSSEQALQNMATRVPAPANSQALQNEVLDLRMQVERQNEAERNSQMQIENLRQQVDLLARLVQNGSKETSADQKAAPEIEIQFEQN